VAAAAVMAWLGVWGLARGSAMGNDEVASRWAASLSLGQLAHLLRHVDAVHGLYYLLLHGWMAVGTSPAVLRVPSVAAMVAAAALLVVLGRRLTGSGWAGLFAGLFMAFTPAVSFYAQTARSYAPVFACVVGQTLALVSVLDAERAGAPAGRITRGWLVYGALVTVGGYLNEMALLVLAAHAVTIWRARPGRPAAGHWAVTAAVGTVLVTPVLALSIGQHAALAYITRPGRQELGLLLHDYFGATIASALLVGACAVVALLPPGLWRHDGAPAAAGAEPGSARPAGGGISLPSVAVPLLLVPAAILIAESLVASPLFQDRYVLYGEAGVALLAGAGARRAGQWLAAAVRRPQLIVAPGLAVCLCFALAQLAAQRSARTPGSRQYNFGSPSFYVAAHARSGDGVLFLDTFYRKAELGYPRDFAKTSDFALAVPPATAASFRGIDKPSSAIQALMLSQQRIWVIGDRPSPLLSARLPREESQLLQNDFTQVFLHHYKGMWLTLWIRR
jgi:mannosyltransferase